MKKLFFALVTAAALISFTSCSDTTKGPNEEKGIEMFKKMGESLKLDSYNLDTVKVDNVLDSADVPEFTKIAGEFDKWFDGLTGPEMEKVEKAVKEWNEKKAKIISEAAENVLPEYNKKSDEGEGDTVPAEANETEANETEEELEVKE